MSCCIYAPVKPSSGFKVRVVSSSSHWMCVSHLLSFGRERAYKIRVRLLDAIDDRSESTGGGRPGLSDVVGGTKSNEKDYSGLDLCT